MSDANHGAEPLPVKMAVAGRASPARKLSSKRTGEVRLPRLAAERGAEEDYLWGV